MRKQFRATVTDLAARDDRLVLLFSDISVFLFKEFQERFPKRFFNIGICESSLISIAAGMGAEGFYPIVHTISPFITERSYEQIKMDMVYNQFGGNIVSCGASFDYPWDGPSHHCYTDLEILRLLPHVEVMQPGSRKELDVLLRSQYANGNVSYFRMTDHPHEIDMDVEFGKGVVMKDVGSEVTVLTAGPILPSVLEACATMDVNVLYFHTIKPLDESLLAKYSETRFLVVHDAYGLYESVCAIPGLHASFHGLGDRFISDYGTLSDARRMAGLDPTSIRQAVESHLRSKQSLKVGEP